MTDSDKMGEELKAQRFQMLKDIAEELKGDIIFPTSFDTIIRLRDILKNENWSLEAVATALGTEPLVASRLVGMANSAAYNTNGTAITDVKRAVMRLGINTVRTTATAIATKQIRAAMSMSVFSDLSERLWKHSLRTASAAFILCKHNPVCDPDEAMLAGMVHDLGAFYMLYRASQYQELCERPDTVKYMIIQWHENIGYTLLEALGMPEEIVEAVHEHDQPRSAPTTMRNLSDIIYVANLLAGGVFEWQYLDSSSCDDLVTKLDSRYTDLLDEIDQHEAEIQGIFS